MGLTKSRGNMYPWTSDHWNPIKGTCPFACSYCYTRGPRFKNSKGPVRFDKKEIKTRLGTGRTIFVGSKIDMWASDIPSMWDLFVLAACQNHPGNEYLFQTKNPERFYRFKNSFPLRCILGVTLESNREYPEISKAPPISERVRWMKRLKEEVSIPRMISIEPIMDFDLESFVEMIEWIRPSFVSIGADSKNHHLPEPSLEKVGELLIALRTITELKIKNNLKRLL